MGEVLFLTTTTCKKPPNVQSPGEAAGSAATQLRTGGREHQEVNVCGGAGHGEMGRKERNQLNSAQSVSQFLSTTTDPHPAGISNLLCLGLVK